MAPKAARRVITQDAFDAAVAENVEEFGMEPEEALAEAVAGLQLQGVDLSNIRTTLPEAGGRRQLHAVEATQQLLAAQAAPSGDTVRTALATLAKHLSGPDVEPDAACAAGAWPRRKRALPCADSVATQGAPERSTACCSPSAASRTRVHAAFLAWCRRSTRFGCVCHGAERVAPRFDHARAPQLLLSETETRDTFVARDGASTLVAHALSRTAEADVVSAGARGASAAASRHESAKVALFKAGAAPQLLAALEAHPSNAAVVAAACWGVAALATADDRSTAASAAFAHGRQLHKLAAHTPLMAALRMHVTAPATAAAACCALRAVAVNDEACVDIAEAGAVDAAVSLLSMRDGADAVLRAALSLLRQLAGADAVKGRFVAAGGLPALLTLLCERPAGVAAVPLCEAGLTLLAALTLRNPDGAAAAAAAGGLDIAVELMALFPGASGLQRAACMYLRNSAARNLELRPLMLERGADALLRAAKAAHPATCNDVGSAALRDLGAANYNEGWTPTTVYMGAGGELYTYEDLGSFTEGDGGAAVEAIPEEEE